MRRSKIQLLDCNVNYQIVMRSAKFFTHVSVSPINRINKSKLISRSYFIYYMVQMQWKLTDSLPFQECGKHLKCTKHRKQPKQAAHYMNSHESTVYYMSFDYMEESVLLGTKPRVDSIRHFIWDPSGVFSLCHLCESRIVQ